MDETALIHRAREAVARGDRDAARQLLIRFLYEQPDSETAWMMMATLVEQPDRKRDCLERALRINPDNEVARSQLAALEAPGPEAAGAPPGQPEPTPEPAAAAPPGTAAPPEAEREPAAPTETPSLSEAEPTALPESELAAEAETDVAELAAQEEPETAEADAIPSIEPAAETHVAEPGTVPDETVFSSTEALAPQDTESEATTAVSPAGSDLPSTEPAPEAGMAPSPQPVAELAPLDDETATVLGNSFLIDSLAPGEQVLYRTTLTPWVFLRPVAALVGAVIVVSLPGGTVPEALLLACRAGLLILSFAYFGMRAIRYFGSEYVVTDRRVLAKRGILARLKVDVPLDEIEEVTVGRGSSGHGSLWIRRADGAQVLFWRIREPGAFREAIERARA